MHLYDPRNGDVSLRVESFSSSDGLSIQQRTNCFSIYWIQQGDGKFRAGEQEYSFAENSILFFNPYQPLQFFSSEVLRGDLIQFHANFLCIETHHEEVGCNGVLFNDIYGLPLITLRESDSPDFARPLEEMRREMQEHAFAHSEVLLSWLKIFLVRATRLKIQQYQFGNALPSIPSELVALKSLIESDFRTSHSPAVYAEKLHISPPVLARLTRKFWKKTLSEVIRDRILKQAKWELLHTLKPVKQIATELGFQDAFYFSRLFKRSTGCSPLFFREFETIIRDGKNLSME